MGILRLKRERKKKEKSARREIYFFLSVCYYKLSRVAI